jgi:hypothetical protein
MHDLSQKQNPSIQNRDTPPSHGTSTARTTLSCVFHHSVPKGLIKQIKSHFLKETFQTYFHREFPSGEKVLVKGKKSGEVEFKKTAEGITLVLSNDVGAWRRFEQKIVATEGKIAQLAALAGDVSSGLSGGQTSQSVGQLLVQQYVSDLTQWARKDFKGDPNSGIQLLLPSEAGDKLRSKKSWIGKISEIGGFSSQAGMPDELQSFQQRFEREIGRLTKKIQPSYGIFDKEVIIQHGTLLGQVGLVSLTRYFSGKNEDVLRFFSKEVVRVFEATCATFEKTIPTALRECQNQTLQELLSVARTFLDSWKMAGIFAVLQALEVELQSPIKLREKYESWFLRAESRLTSMIHSNAIIENDRAPQHSEILPILHLLPALEAVLPSASIPTGNDLRPHREEIFRFGRELIAIARSSDPKVAGWFRSATSGGLYYRDSSVNDYHQVGEDFPAFLLELLCEMCAWAASSTPMSPFPKIQGGGNLYVPLLRNVLYHGALSLFEAMTGEEGTTPTKTLENYYHSFEKVVGMLKAFDVDECQSTFLSLGKYFAKFEVLCRQAAEANQIGLHHDARRLRESAIEVMIGSGKYFLGLNKEIQVDLEQEIVIFLSRMSPLLNEIDLSGEIGRQLTAIETGVAMLEVIDSASELKNQFKGRLYRISIELIDACKHARSVDMNSQREYDEVSHLLACIEVEIQKWEALGAFPGSRSHCADELWKSRRAFEKSRRAKFTNLSPVGS